MGTGLYITKPDGSDGIVACCGIGAASTNKMSWLDLDTMTWSELGLIATASQYGVFRKGKSTLLKEKSYLK